MMRTIGRGFLLQTAAIILVPLLCASVLAAQEPLQFNVPYHCPDGTDNIITRCAPYKGRETCIWRVEKNGQLIHEVSNVRSQMDGWLAVCKVQTSQAATPGQPNQANPQTLTSQPLNPPYLSDPPWKK